VTVVSGGARGVDSAAMSAGIVGSGTVVGVLADSLLKESGRKDYRDAIRDGRLCLMSEVHPEAKFDVGSAMARNRLAYACADAALVIECEVNKGGTWAGAMEALREGKPVYVLKGARAERQLVDKGAAKIDIDFAVQVDRLVKSERPGPTPERANLVEAVLRELLTKGGLNKEALAARLRDEANQIADRLVDAAISEGWAETLVATESEPSGAVVPAAPAVKRARKSNKRPVVASGVLFSDEAIAG
jgi:predicted Rossmann fold nucleotide-binding protein DprA/Smf involved in DNA uptake